ncbi:gephyrin-like molybdotransferase Glp [Novispirillum sp. DQ9]|uniref:molybdopterin molybdotransferase MoeA n=1 Tax=Novispirillum sp. DQ9 TaxID=3398612 RepID=UPI003C7E9EC1
MPLNDCFAVADRLMPLDDALAFIAGRVSPVVGTEVLPLRACRGRVLAADVAASATLPPHPCSAMDGFAARHADLRTGTPTTLPLAGRVAAGHPLAEAPPPGSAVELFTGAPLPDGFDTVAQVEDCRIEDGRVTFPAGLKPGNHVRPAGEDYTAGARVLAAGRRLKPQDIALAAGAGHAALTVFRRLRVGVFSTGDEVVEPGGALGPGQIYNSNRYGQIALAEALGADVTDLGHLPDDVDAIAAALAGAAPRFDALLTSGGVSMGGEDHVRPAVLRHGALHLWRVKVKPGKPIALGQVGDTAFIGLPGYPVSALVMLMLLGRPVLKRLMGATADPLMPAPIPVRAGFQMSKKHERQTFLRASLVPAADGGGLEAVPYPTQQSGVLASLSDSDGLLDIAADRREVAPGDWLPYTSYQALQW